MKILTRLLFALLMIPILSVYIITVLVDFVFINILLCGVIGNIQWIITGKCRDYCKFFTVYIKKRDRIFGNTGIYLCKKIVKQ